MATKTKAKPAKRMMKKGTGRAKRAAPLRKAGPKRATRRSAPARKAAVPALAPVAGPVAAPAERPDVSRPAALALANAGLDKKAEDVTVLDVRGLSSYADYFVIMTADSDRQASAIADHLEQTMKQQGFSKVGVEGYETGRWILVDYGDVIAHVMSRETRGFYDLEGLWADAPRFRVEG
jgi:ribosome-associated protein